MLKSQLKRKINRISEQIGELFALSIKDGREGDVEKVGDYAVLIHRLSVMKDKLLDMLEGDCNEKRN